jgi:hypothetical protein
MGKRFSGSLAKFREKSGLTAALGLAQESWEGRSGQREQGGEGRKWVLVSMEQRPWQKPQHLCSLTPVIDITKGNTTWWHTAGTRLYSLRDRAQ